MKLWRHCSVAFATSFAAYWTQFRLLLIYPDKENLRIASAFTIAIAVCGMHYTGMTAADFVFDPSVYSPAPLQRG